MAICVDKDETATKSRLVHVSLLSLNLRIMENWRSAQIKSVGSALDYECLMILMAIIVISSERVLRSDLEPQLQTLEKRLPSERIGKVNLSSIASATAINRETVRRKVNKLQKGGWLIRDEEGIRMVHGVLGFDVLRDTIEAQLDAFARTANQLSRLGVLSTSAA